MENNLYDKTERLIKHWWLSLIVGLVALAIGFIVLVHPAASYYTFATWLGLAILISGIAGLVQALGTRNYFVRRGWLMLAAIADIIIGLLLVFNTLLSAVAMPILLGAWLLYRGCAMLMQGFDLRSYGVRDAGWVIFYAAVIIAISIAVLWMPGTLGVEAVILFVAIAFITYGVSMISLSFRLWDIHHHAQELGSEE
ncbi:MAG: DUF308 domain-containing protein [Alistipes sp.]|nr:DUF308 domain-containing protein [Alistipes sp.]MBQ3249027.1 DUF308 domain-containing protein [Alistipes sp.]MBR3826652.1 DUF308 domain-containing protein [Alistipes sp.]